MSRATERPLVIFTDDDVADRTLTRLEEDGRVSKAGRYVRGSKIPEGSIHIVHRPNQGLYVVVEQSGKNFIAYVRESTSGKTGRERRAHRRIPALVEKMADPGIRCGL